MRIGIMGGTFNPPHIGHLNAISAARAALSLDRVILIPDSDPPHKKLPENSPSARQRFEMTKLVAEEVSAEVSDMELCRGGKSYTADTLAELSRQYKDDELWLIVGTDMFLTIDEWKRPKEIFGYAKLAVVPRDDGDLERLDRHAEQLREEFGAICRVVKAPAIPIASTALRMDIGSSAHLRLIPKSVCEYIKKNALYGVGKEDSLH